jgi:hypothetical protein
MAALASSAVSLYPTGAGAAEFYPKGKDDRSVITRRLLITSLAQGDATDTIGASALGFTTLLSASSLWDDTNSKGYPTVVNPITNVIILLDGSAAPAPVKVTTTSAYITVTGVK